jgi:hypothetical protein
MCDLIKFLDLMVFQNAYFLAFSTFLYIQNASLTWQQWAKSIKQIIPYFSQSDDLRSHILFSGNVRLKMSTHCS